MTPIRILIVDDELGMRLGIQRSLHDQKIEVPDIEGEYSFEMQLAETGEEAVELITNQVPDILLLDYKLPGINGLDVLTQTADIAGDMITIMITAYASIETAIAATKQGAYGFLPKPFTPAALRHKVRKAAIRVLLTKRAKELEAKNKRARFEFIRILGHELKAPLAAVSGYMYTMRDKILGDDIASYQEMVARSLLRLDQMTKMIGDLLDMTRLESGEKLRNLEDLDLVTCIRDALDVGKPEANKRGIEIQMHCPKKLIMHADHSEIDMILNNLISNAVKYNRDNGKIDIHLDTNKDNVTVSVSDTGVGMTEKERQLLFKEFVRIKNDKTRHTLGSGLGLSILKNVVGLYNGTITVESEPGIGSTFTITLKHKNNEIE